MPGNPNECRLHALNCMQLAEDATDSELRRIYVDLAHHWNRLHWRISGGRRGLLVLRKEPRPQGAGARAPLKGTRLIGRGRDAEQTT